MARKKGTGTVYCTACAEGIRRAQGHLYQRERATRDVLDPPTNNHKTIENGAYRLRKGSETMTIEDHKPAPGTRKDCYFCNPEPCRFR